MTGIQTNPNESMIDICFRNEDDDVFHGDFQNILKNEIEQQPSVTFVEYNPTRCYQSQLPGNLSSVKENRQIGQLYVEVETPTNETKSMEKRYHLLPSGECLLVLERDSTKVLNRLTIYSKPESTETIVLPLASRFITFCPDKWLVSCCGRFCAVAGYAKDKLELHMEFLKLIYRDNHGYKHFVGFQKLQKQNSNSQHQGSSSFCDEDDSLDGKLAMRLITWAINGKTLVTFTSKFLRVRNTIQMSVFTITDTVVKCKLHFDLSQRIILFGEISDVCLSEVNKAVLFTTNVYQVFRYNYETHTISPAVVLEGITLSHVRKPIFLRQAQWAVSNSKENYYICTANAALYHIDVEENDNLNITKKWSLKQYLEEDQQVIDFLIDEYSTRACFLLDNGDVLSFDLKMPLESFKVILVNSDLNFSKPRVVVNWRTAEIMVYSNKHFSCHLLPYRQFTLKHLALKAVIRLFKKESIEKLELAPQIKRDLLLEMPENDRAGSRHQQVLFS